MTIKIIIEADKSEWLSFDQALLLVPNIIQQLQLKQINRGLFEEDDPQPGVAQWFVVGPDDHFGLTVIVTATKDGDGLFEVSIQDVDYRYMKDQNEEFLGYKSARPMSQSELKQTISDQWESAMDWYEMHYGDDWHTEATT